MGFMPGWDDDLFCEFITFDETRLYTKQVMKSYYIYRWLEETQGK